MKKIISGILITVFSPVLIWFYRSDAFKFNKQAIHFANKYKELEDLDLEHYKDLQKEYDELELKYDKVNTEYKKLRYKYENKNKNN